jgi:cell cycle checkpoint protein
LIEDDWLADDWIEDDVLGNTSGPAQKLTIRDSVRKHDSTISKAVPRTSSKRFILDDDAPVKRTEVTPTEETDRRPWSEKYAPHLIDQLAVHKKKVADVREWLSAALSGRSIHVSFYVCLLIG